ncbi:hypothetical protein BDY21DRAFT_105619 [Lineolata rhizophorae]|uniref:Uncharacterized protein n=1 Tax=Lineolata rhizophorae TaxID=578093 RepID=A0A6A6NRZ3_9PEZI|nr:hypothetical protein BDY21DRAFT_105619 [Lineolata rhizophorae]
MAAVPQPASRPPGSIKFVARPCTSFRAAPPLPPAASPLRVMWPQPVPIGPTVRHTLFPLPVRVGRRRAVHGIYPPSQAGTAASPLRASAGREKKKKEKRSQRRERGRAFLSSLVRCPLVRKPCDPPTSWEGQAGRCDVIGAVHLHLHTCFVHTAASAMQPALRPASPCRHTHPPTHTPTHPPTHTHTHTHTHTRSTYARAVRCGPGSPREVFGNEKH